MIDVGIKEKIWQLKARFRGDDVDPSAIRQIAEWEKRIQELSLKDDFMQSPVAQEAAKILRLKIKKEMIYRLQPGLKEQDRLLSDRAEKELRFALGLFSLNYEQELESLETLIDQELV